jgi:hypothetical protein
MNVKKVIRVALTACTLLAGAAHATTLNLPDANPLSATTYNNFTVYSLDLLQQCQPVDPRCQPSGPYPVASSPGAIKDQAVILNSSNGQTNLSNDPFANGSSVDEIFLTPTGNQSSSYTMTDVGGQFVGDQANRWDIKLSQLQSYLGTHDLVFLFDNNQSGNGSNQYVNIWGQARIIDAAGNTVSGLCFEISTGSGCGTDNPLDDSTFLPVISDFCVDKVTGASYKIGLAQNAGDCPVEAGHPQGGYQVNNNISTSTAEFAAVNLALNAAALDPLNGELFLSINIRYTGNDAGAEQLWICSACDVTGERVNVPEPATLALFGISLLGLAFFRRRNV